MLCQRFLCFLSLKELEYAQQLLTAFHQILPHFLFQHLSQDILLYIIRQDYLIPLHLISIEGDIMSIRKCGNKTIAI